MPLGLIFRPHGYLQGGGGTAAVLLFLRAGYSLAFSCLNFMTRAKHISLHLVIVHQHSTLPRRSVFTLRRFLIRESKSRISWK